MSLPERINVMKVVTYDVTKIVADILESRRINWGDELGDEVELWEIMEYIEDWVEDDFGTLNGLIYQDENGEEL